MPEDFEYELEPLREGAEFTVYRGRERGNQMPILAVVVAAEQPSPQCLRRLEQEYLLATELDAAWAAQPLALTRHRGRAVLILKDPGGEPLDRIIEQHKGQPIDLNRFLRIAIGLAAALSQAHRQGLIHKDVKPANALVDDSDHVWLTGFGFASRLQHERQVPVTPEVIAGTFAYMAPEQTGRMNRSIDSRSDLYSLGVTFYQMLTGALPFAAADPLEWIHCHIARQPAAPVDRPGVTKALSDIVMRLLAKNAEERYQTAAGLEADLRRCLMEWQLQGRIDPFTLGADDASDRLLIPEKLYGREREVEALIAAFDRVVAQGAAELVLVSGYSGVGKSSVVNELHKVLVPPRGLFAAGKFEQHKRDIPYTTLAQAFQMLVRQILVKSEAELVHWRHALMEALGPNGQLIVNLIPEVEFVIGKQPPVTELPPQEALGRFQLVFRRFLGAFARPEHPLTLFLDDLQWLDTATLQLLERLVADPDVRHVLLIGAYRDNEVSSSHPLMRTLAAIRAAGGRAQEIVLAPLGLDDVERLIADALHCGLNSAGSLALLVYEKTGGNPFFAIQFLAELAEEGLLRFDQDAAAWIWDLDLIRRKSYSGNVVDLMLGKLRRLPHHTQTALQQLASLGNSVEIAALNMVFGRSEEELHTALLDSVRTGLILRMGGSYAFLHDRIQEAAYALIPESARAEVHLRIGRVLLTSMTADRLAKHLFDVANQLNRAAILLIDHEEKVHVAAIDLRAGRKAKVSAAYASARGYFAAGMGLLEENDWSGQYELAFSLWLERAECELLCGNSAEAGQLIEQLLPRAASKVDEAAVYCLKVQLQIMNSEYQQAVTTALTCLRGFGIDMPTHPTEEQVQSVYGALWQTLNGRPIESLIDLPLMTDPELQAAMHMLSVLIPCAYFTDQRLFRLQICRMVAISLQHGASMDAATGYVYFGIVLGTVLHRYRDGFLFAKLACDLLDRYGFVANRGTVYATFGAVASWTQPIATVIDFYRTGIPAAIETGNLLQACFGLQLSLTHLLIRGDPLDLVWRESEMALDFTQKAKYHDVANIIVSQQRFIATLQGRTAALSTFNDAQFNEATFEAQLTGERMPVLICCYWIVKLQARFLSGDYAEALEAAGKAQRLLQALAGQIAAMDYYYYTALIVSALYETASVDQQAPWRILLMEHQEQLREWAENYPPTFADKHTLVLAEIARLEKRDLDAQRLYEQAIHLARLNGFVQNQGLAHELAAQYNLARGLETAGYAHLRSARNCFQRWGAHGKVKQLDERYPNLQDERTSAASAAAGSSAAQLDVEAVAKASQTLSSEIVLPTLIEKLVQIAVENAGAARGLLILIRDLEPQIEAEATTGHNRVKVTLRKAVVTPSDLLQPVLHYVIRTQKAVLIDDASADKVYSKDEYVRQKRSRSILCVPIVKQTKLVGALYLENGLTPSAFTPERVTLLQLLASQAAISLDNAALYTDLQRAHENLQQSEAFLTQAQKISQTGSFGFNVEKAEIYWSDETYNIFEHDRAAKPTFESVLQIVYPDDRLFVQQALGESTTNKTGFDVEYRLLMADGRVKHVHASGLAVITGGLEIVGAVRDITERSRAEEALRQAQGDLARINRVTTIGELTASLAHELNQPITGAITNADVCLRWLERDKPDLDAAGRAVTRIARDARRAAEIIGRIHSLFARGNVSREVIDVNEINRDTVALLRDEAARYNIAVRMDLAADLPNFVGDRVQLQQVAMNLIVNSIEAMKDVDGLREMVIRSERTEDEQILVSVSDTGVGFPPQLAEQIFDPFFTTKPQGTGMGLRICRSIIESHGGRLWGVGTPGHGATFHLSLPIARNVPLSLITGQSSGAVVKPIGGATHQGHRKPGLGASLTLPLLSRNG
jgi:predicted ATPase/signal transduction histidine kinase